jgi:hypothetical protein
MGFWKKVKRAASHAAKEAGHEIKKGADAVGGGVEHVIKEGSHEIPKAAVHVWGEIKDHVLSTEGNPTPSPVPTIANPGMTLRISGSGVGCGVKVTLLDGSGDVGQCQDPDARTAHQCRNVFSVAFDRAKVRSVCQLNDGELWVSTDRRWDASWYGPSVQK